MYAHSHIHINSLPRIFILFFNANTAFFFFSTRTQQLVTLIILLRVINAISSHWRWDKPLGCNHLALSLSPLLTCLLLITACLHAGMSRERRRLHLCLHHLLLHKRHYITLHNTTPAPSPSLHNYAITHTQPHKHAFTYKKKKKACSECEAKSLGLTSMWPLMYEAFSP